MAAQKRYPDELRERAVKLESGKIGDSSQT